MYLMYRFFLIQCSNNKHSHADNINKPEITLTHAKYCE